ncbi:MAG: hypothetical protein ACP5E4_04680 [Candidatus Aenigmatarchaeota archaeon]
MVKPKKQSSGLSYLILVAVLLVLAWALINSEYVVTSGGGEIDSNANTGGELIGSADEIPEHMDVLIGELIPLDELYLENCAYDGYGSIVCDTNCVESGLVVLAAADSEGKTAKSIAGDISDGTMSLYGGVLLATPVASATGESATYSLGELKKPDTWTVFFSCSLPEGEKIIFLPVE